MKHFGQRGSARVSLIWLTVAAVIVGASGTFLMYWQARKQRLEATANRAEVERQRAIGSDLEKQRDEALRLAESRQTELEQSRRQLETAQHELAQSAHESLEARQQLDQLTAQLRDLHVEAEAEKQRADAGDHDVKIAQEKAKAYRRMFDSAITRLSKTEGAETKELLDGVSARYKKAARMPAEALGDLQHDLAWLHYRVKDYEGAEAFGRVAVETRQASLGEADPATLDSMSNLASTLKKQGKLAEAMDIQRQVAELSEKALGPQHEKTLRALGALSDYLFNEQRYEELERTTGTLCERLLAKRSNSTAVFYLDWRARALHALDQYSEAESLLRELLELNLRGSGPDHRKTFRTKCHLAWMLGLQSRAEGAASLHVEIAELAEFMEAIGRPYRSETYGGYLTFLGEYEAAEEALVGNYEARVYYGDAGLVLNHHIRPLINLYETWGRPEGAARYRAMLFNGTVDSTGSD